MASNRLKVSLIIVSVLALGLLGASFLVDTEAPFEIPVASDTVSRAELIVDFGNGVPKSFALEPHGENLFVLTKNKLSQSGIELGYEKYAGLGELITRIGDKKGGTDGKYWQYWVNGNYAQVGASSYSVKPDDVIEWKFTGQAQQQESNVP
ncbi:MAG: DUF4430 domain-containing protein [Candidatus Colwellbacteria bacterium]|nr:DUF4430 domain-containing protein [Candidatus Colwellbacteria bacterium]